MKSAKKWISTNWLIAFVYIFGVVAVTVVLWIRLGNLVPGLSSAELSQYNDSAMTKSILNNPFYLPQKVLQLTGYLLGLDPVIALRGASTILGLMVLGSLYYVLKSWYSQRIAILGVFLLLSSDWFLHIARNGSAAISYMCLFLAFAGITWIQRSRAKSISLIGSALVLVLLLYTPAMVWFVVPLILWRSKWIAYRLRMQKPIIIALCVVGGVISLSPLFITLVSHPELIIQYLGLPEAWPSFTTFIKQTLSVPVHIFISSSPNYEMQLSSLPLVSWFVSAMFAIGTYTYFFKRRLDRTWSLLYIFITGSILIGLGGSTHIALLLPFIILVAMGGIALMLQQWFTVFPRNPFARGVGIVLILIALGTSSYYSMNKYFVAWPNTPEVKDTYGQQIL